MNGNALQKLVRSTPPRCLRRLTAKRVPMPATWGRGVATRALAAFLGEAETTRPLFAGVVAHNAGSMRVLEKCGFSRTGEIVEDGLVIFRLG